MKKQGVAWPEVRARRIARVGTIAEVKDWRSKEAAAGRPSEYSDYCRAKGFCTVCNAEGVTPNDDGIGFKPVGWDGSNQLFQYCPVCDGTGVASISKSE